MVNQNTASIIHKKALVAREDFDARAMSSAKALRLSLARSADTLFDLALTVMTVEQLSLNAPALEEAMNGDGLLTLLDGAGGARGAVLIDVQFIAALIEMQVAGSVRPAPAMPRIYTRTDAAMAAPFLDSVLAGFDEQLGSASSDYRPRGFRFGDKLENARALTLILDSGRYDLFRVTVDIAGGAKTGTVAFLLPKRADTSQSVKLHSHPAWQKPVSLERNVLDASASLDAVLTRLTMPLKDVCKLAPGMVLDLPADVLGNAQLFAPKRHLVADVRLGQLSGMRAVRFSTLGAVRPVGAASSGPDDDAAGATANVPDPGQAEETKHSTAQDAGQTDAAGPLPALPQDEPV